MAHTSPDFGPTVRARFVARPNRFLVRCELESGERVRASLPNPGRLQELLLPGVGLRVVDLQGRIGPKGPRRGRAPRKTRFQVLVVESRGASVFLDTHATNRVARHLIENGRVPGLEGAEIVRAEAPHGRSRFDFLLRESGLECYAEVKSVTLFHNQVAMFPDAVTERGRRHLIELAELGKEAASCPGMPRPVVLFVVHAPRVRWFMPDYHTDLAFSRTLLDVREHLRIVPLAVGWTPGLRLRANVRLLEIPWEHIEREARDTGSYLTILHLPRKRVVEVGGLGPLHFPKGHYVYVGSAMRNLTARLARHARRRKRLHWHVDYLRQTAEHVTGLPIRASTREECTVAQALGRLLEPGPPGFGCSDCRCATHLFRSASNPLSTRGFSDLLLGFRMKAPAG